MNFPCECRFITDSIHALDIMDLLRIIIVLCLMNTRSADLLPVNVTTIKDLCFNRITSIITGPAEQLVITDQRAVWNVNIEVDPPIKHLIAGANTSGYREGTGADAQFDNLSDVIVMNVTHILVTDRSNHCLRTIDLQTNTTSTYAGTCDTCTFRCIGSRYHNGYRLGAKFNLPRGLLKLADKIYIIDSFNNAVRVLESDYVTTLAHVGSQFKSPKFAAACDDYIYVTFSHGVFRINLKDETTELITGSTTTGAVNHDLASSRLFSPIGITHLNNHVLAVAQNNNRYLTIINLRDDRVSSICSGQSGTIDGNRTHCGFFYPNAVHVFGDSLLVGEASGMIRRLPLYSVIEESDVSKCLENLPSSTTTALESTTSVEATTLTTKHTSSKAVSTIRSTTVTRRTSLSPTEFTPTTDNYALQEPKQHIEVPTSATQDKNVQLKYLRLLSPLGTIILIVAIVVIVLLCRRGKARQNQERNDVEMNPPNETHFSRCNSEDSEYTEIHDDYEQTTSTGVYAVYCTQSANRSSEVQDSDRHNCTQHESNEVPPMN